ncbi:MAG: LacI family DNA-binding transcriptional regulator [Blautia sp.]|nr:LacI family DNA-binding transcriptional regulator [Blautia sp.]
MPQKINIKTIAALSGVSVATVSRIINQNGRFSAETEARVRKVMEDLNYHPNTVAKSLRQDHSMVIGILVPDITNTHFSRLILEIETCLFRFGYSTLICNTNEDRELEKQHMDALISQRVSGILCLTGNRQTAAGSIPVVYLDRRPDGYTEAEDHLVESDNRQGGCLQASALLDAGCSNIAVLYAKGVDLNHMMRLEGCCQTLAMSGINAKALSVDRVSAPLATAAIRELAAQDPHIDGLACTNDLLAVGAFLGLLEMGIRVPEMLKLTGYDDSPLANVYNPSITSIHQDAQAMARSAADMLLRMIDGESISGKHIMLPTRLITRGSTK